MIESDLYAYPDCILCKGSGMYERAKFGGDTEWAECRCVTDDEDLAAKYHMIKLDWEVVYP